uniref:Uncharacterized protein n=1 Tax=Tanacetum cinerariifolium TaxID=118510 RepID=A0A6L2MUQ5_TANCI|nr:hypothetical protein [Tanacetum cinerariifolium]
MTWRPSLDMKKKKKRWLEQEKGEGDEEGEDDRARERKQLLEEFLDSRMMKFVELTKSKSYSKQPQALEHRFHDSRNLVKRYCAFYESLLKMIPPLEQAKEEEQGRKMNERKDGCRGGLLFKKMMNSALA